MTNLKMIMIALHQVFCICNFLGVKFNFATFTATVTKKFLLKNGQAKNADLRLPYKLASFPAKEIIGINDKFVLRKQCTTNIKISYNFQIPFNKQDNYKQNLDVGQIGKEKYNITKLIHTSGNSSTISTYYCQSIKMPSKNQAGHGASLNGCGLTRQESLRVYELVNVSTTKTTYPNSPANLEIHPSSLTSSRKVKNDCRFLLVEQSTLKPILNILVKGRPSKISPTETGPLILQLLRTSIPKTPTFNS